MFEAAIEGVPQNQAKGRSLIFEIAGEGNLPRTSIVKPTVRNKKGQPLLLYKRNLVGRTQTLPLVITNDGTLPSKVRPYSKVWKPVLFSETIVVGFFFIYKVKDFVTEV